MLGDVSYDYNTLLPSHNFILVHTFLDLFSGGSFHIYFYQAYNMQHIYQTPPRTYNKIIITKTTNPLYQYIINVHKDCTQRVHDNSTRLQQRYTTTLQDTFTKRRKKTQGSSTKKIRKILQKIIFFLLLPVCESVKFYTRV